MLIISHRGLINGPSPGENSPSLIDATIEIVGAVEVDVWVLGGEIFLGHDSPTYKVDHDWLMRRRGYLWIHCKNIPALVYFFQHLRRGNTFHYFWHEEDVAAITSLGFIWAYPGKQPIKNSIAVLPELFDERTDACLGVCTDYVFRYLGR